MKRYQLVDALAWEQSICSVLYESDDVAFIEKLETKLGEAMNQRLEVVDTWDRRNQFPSNAKPLFKTERDVAIWFRKHEAEQRRKLKNG